MVLTLIIYQQKYKYYEQGYTYNRATYSNYCSNFDVIFYKGS